MGDFKSIWLDLVKSQNTQQLQVQEKMKEKWQKQLLSQQKKKKKKKKEKITSANLEGKSRETAWISKSNL